ncbi:hypothetical protein, partial [Pseudomonas kuykendallii]|uniref:hypothetical protein n=1 Tax=Pseudomonas kuykendallii TaxID=1007099 RepID=UPI00289DBA3F
QLPMICGLWAGGVYGADTAIRQDASRHPYVSAVCKDGQGRMIVQTARSDVQELLCLCEHFAVDQEFVSADDIVRLAGKPLSCYG